MVRVGKDLKSHSSPRHRQGHLPIPGCSQPCPEWLWTLAEIHPQLLWAPWASHPHRDLTFASKAILRKQRHVAKVSPLFVGSLHIATICFCLFNTAWHCLSLCSYTFHLEYPAVVDRELWLQCHLGVPWTKMPCSQWRGQEGRGVSAQPHFSSEVPMVSPAQGTGNQRSHQLSAQPCPAAALLSCSRAQGQGLVKREVISECFIERQTCTIRSEFC